MFFGSRCQTRKKESGHRSPCRSQVRRVQSIAHTHPARGGVDINDAVPPIHLSALRPSSVTGSLACIAHVRCCLSCATPLLRGRHHHDGIHKKRFHGTGEFEIENEVRYAERCATSQCSYYCTCAVYTFPDNGINVTRKSASVVLIRNIGSFRLAYSSVSSNEWKEMHACMQRQSERGMDQKPCVWLQLSHDTR